MEQMHQPPFFFSSAGLKLMHGRHIVIFISAVAFCFPVSLLLFEFKQGILECLFLAL